MACARAELHGRAYAEIVEEKAQCRYLAYGVEKLSAAHSRLCATDSGATPAQAPARAGWPGQKKGRRVFIVFIDAYLIAERIKT